MIMSASVGRSGVVRWPRRNSEGSLCQNEAVESGVGRLAMSLGYAVAASTWILIDPFIPILPLASTV